LRARSVILLYHRITRLETDPWSMSVTPEHFAEHLHVLRRYRLVRLDQIQPPSTFFSGLSIAVTFDDGYADNLYNAAPLLEQFDTPCTFFIASGYIGGHREFWWDELEQIVSPSTPLYRRLYTELQPLPHETRCERFKSLSPRIPAPRPVRSTHRALTEAELLKLAAHPLFEIGAHTVTHPLLAAQPPHTQFAEIKESKQRLESLLNRPLTSFSYPYGGRGHYSDVTVQAVRDAGFLRACTTEGWPVRKRDSPFEWGRLNVTDMDGEQFENLLLA
jgi:peptidoglycan/xylan/chitin deacetylase (PgdA/CDA1 family)